MRYCDRCGEQPATRAVAIHVREALHLVGPMAVEKVCGECSIVLFREYEAVA